MILILTLIVLSTTGEPPADPGEAPGRIPEYLSWWPGLFVRIGDGIVDAPEADQQLARGYPFQEDKGEVIDGRRMSIMAAPGPYHAGDEIRIIHVVEAPEPGWLVYGMGPKQVFGEFVDGVLVTEATPGWADPFVPEMYDGCVLDSPAVDYNYDITSYRFEEPGMHEVQWIMDGWESNVLRIEVVPDTTVCI
jgi:hypothetical protein